MANGLRIVVTGGSGRIGTAVVQRLLEHGHSPIVLDRRAPHANVPFVFIDLRDRQALQPVLEGADGVIHLGEVPHQHAGESPHDVYVRNTATGSTVLQTAADLKIPRFIYTSSAQVYGIWGSGLEGYTKHRPVKFPIDESQPLSPTNVYALAKAANEGYARILAEKQGFNVAVFRLPHVIGAHHLKMIARWPTGGPSWAREETDGIWTYLHDKDAADAYVAALNQIRPGFEAYNLAAADIKGPTPLRERLAAMPVSHWPPLPADWPERGSPVSTEKARLHFGWSPKSAYLDLLEAARADRT
jgi:nucleoside-diphosphate-sugar epimerase